MKEIIWFLICVLGVFALLSHVPGKAIKWLDLWFDQQIQEMQIETDSLEPSEFVP